MSKPDTRPRRGRPPRDLVDVLRTQLWMRVLKLHSGLPSAYAIEKALEPHLVRQTGDSVSRPRKWDAYERGARVPRRTGDAGDAVALAELHFPGTAAWFDSPVWDLFKGVPLDHRDLRAMLLRLSPGVARLLLSTDCQIIEGQPELVPLTTAHFDQLVVWGDFDAFAATLILARMAEVAASAELRDLALRCYVDLQPILAKAPGTCVHFPDLYTYADQVCRSWEMSSPGVRISRLIHFHGFPWAEYCQDHIKARLAPLYRARGWSKRWE